MKKIFTLLFALIISSSLTRAQQGNFLVGAMSDIGDQPIIYWGLTPTVGYFITDNICFGTGFKSASMTEDIMDPWMGTGEILGEYSADSLILNPFARYYMNDFFVHGGLNIATGKSESNYDNNDNTLMYDKVESKTSTFGVMIAAGYSLKWGKHFVFEPMIGLRTSTGTQKTKTTDFQSVVTENEYNLPSTTDIGVSLGISFILGNN